MKTEVSGEAIKRPITMVLILFIVVIVYFSGPSTAFYASGYPTMAHAPGTKDINVSVTFYKERYEAIGTIGAKLFKVPPNPTDAEIAAFRTTPWVYETVGATDYNCWAAPYETPSTGQNNTSFYSYDLNAYYTPNAPNGPFAPATQMDGNFDIFAYGYMWDPWDLTHVAPGLAGGTRAPTDANFAYKFIDWSNDMGFSYGGCDGMSGDECVATIDAAAAQFGYYGFSYNYAGKFTCVFKFKSVPEGIYLGIVPYINGLKVGASGWDSGGAGVTPEGSKSGSIILIKDVNSASSTDLNFIEPSGTRRISFTVPLQTALTANATFITVDVNADNVSAPSGADFNMGTSTKPPRFTFGSDASSLTLTSAATLKIYWTGVLTAAQASAILTKMTMYQYNPSTAAWTRKTTDINADANEMKITVTSFV